MSDDNLSINDGLVPFADRRFRRDDMVEVTPPGELAELLEREVAERGVDLPSEDFLEVRCVSREFATAVFMLRRDSGGELRMLAPAGVLRRPS